MHVREQIAHGIVAHLRGHVPGLDDRVYKDGSVGWDRETFPWAVVKTGASRVSVEPGSADGLQLRELDVGIELHDLNLLGAVDYVAKLGDAAVAVEARMANGLRRAVGIDECELTGDSGVQDIDLDARGIHAGVGLTFTVRFYTATGDAASLVTGGVHA